MKLVEPTMMVNYPHVFEDSNTQNLRASARDYSLELPANLAARTTLVKGR